MNAVDLFPSLKLRQREGSSFEDRGLFYLLLKFEGFFLRSSGLLLITLPSFFPIRFLLCFFADFSSVVTMSNARSSQSKQYVSVPIYPVSSGSGSDSDSEEDLFVAGEKGRKGISSLQLPFFLNVCSCFAS
jgi:hypothetical protein